MITIRERNYNLNVELGENICDIINIEMVNTLEFLEDETNVIFIIEGKNIGLSSDFFNPPRDDQIIYNCLSGFNELHLKIKEAIEYINMESVGIVLDPPNKNIGVLIEKDKLLSMLKKSQIIRLDPSDSDPIISATTKSFFLNSAQHGSVSALHCQGNYIGVIYEPTSCIELIDDNSNSNLPEKYQYICKKEESYNLKDYDYLIDFYNSKSVLDISINVENIISILEIEESYYDKYESFSFFKYISDIVDKDHMVIGGLFPIFYIKNKLCDVDLYLHSCSNIKARGIIRKICQLGSIKNITDYPDKIILSLKKYKDNIVIHKNIYTSPSEIAHSFDIDCLCIIYDFKKERFYVTERGLYSIRNNLNVIHKMLPDYERRLLKCTGFNFYIPDIQYFKDNFNIDITSIKSFNKGNIINQYMLTYCNYPNLNQLDGGIEYDKSEITKLIVGLNFSHHITPTFLDINWYPTLISNHNMYEYPYSNDELRDYEDKFSKPNYETNILSSYNLYCNNLIETKLTEKVNFNFIKLLTDGNIGNVIAFGECVIENFLQKHISNSMVEICFIDITLDKFNDYVSLLTEGYKSYNMKFIDKKVITKVEKTDEYIIINYIYSEIPSLKIHKYICKDIKDVYSYLKTNDYDSIIMMRYINDNKEFIISDYDKYYIDNKLIKDRDENNIDTYRKIIDNNSRINILEDLFFENKYNEQECNVRLLKDNIKTLFNSMDISLLDKGDRELIGSEEYKESFKKLQEQQAEREERIKRQREVQIELDKLENANVSVDIFENYSQEDDEEEYIIRRNWAEQEEEEDEEENDQYRMDQYWSGVDQDESYEEDQENDDGYLNQDDQESNDDQDDDDQESNDDQDDQESNDDQDDDQDDQDDREYKAFLNKINAMLDELLYLKFELTQMPNDIESQELFNNLEQIKRNIEEELEFKENISISRIIDDIDDSKKVYFLSEIAYKILKETDRNKEELILVIEKLIEILEEELHFMNHDDELYNIYTNKITKLNEEENILKQH